MRKSPAHLAHRTVAIEEASRSLGYRPTWPGKAVLPIHAKLFTFEGYPDMSMSALSRTRQPCSAFSWASRPARNFPSGLNVTAPCEPCQTNWVDFHQTFTACPHDGATIMRDSQSGAPGRQTQGRQPYLGVRMSLRSYHPRARQAPHCT